MTGHHVAPPVGSAARDTTASPYHGKRREPGPCYGEGCDHVSHAPRAALDPDPPRCWSCGHPHDALCECACCGAEHEGGHPDDV